jgi:hypothetical protein
MSSPAQMFDHGLDAPKGWPSPYAVDKAACLSADETGTVVAGMVCSLDANAELRLGLTESAMAIFIRQNATDFDVVSDDGGLVGCTDARPKMAGLVAKGAYELETTEFNTAGTFNPNTPLTSPAPGVANAGRLDVGVIYTDTICGVASDGVITNERSVDVLRFWPVWLPVAP